MSEKYTYTLARVRLEDGAVVRQELEETLVQTYLGGAGLGRKLIQDHNGSLIFLTGPLTDAAAPNGGRWCAVTRSPVTGQIIVPSSGSAWGRALKRAGWDGLLLEGEAPEWSLLCIDGGIICLQSAADYRGLHTGETAQLLKAKYGSCSVLSIGPAGENRVPLSAIFCDSGRAFGRDGIGAAMGARKLKAIIVRAADFEALPTHACADCALHCGHADAARGSALYGDYGLDAIGAARAVAAAQELHRRGIPDIPDWEEAEWIARISSPADPLTKLVGAGAKALCDACHCTDLLAPPPKTARSRKDKPTPTLAALTDSLGGCIFSAGVTVQDYAAQLHTVGLPCSPEALLQSGKAICELEAE